VALFSPGCSSNWWGPRRLPGPQSSFSTFRPRFSPTAQIWLHLRQWDIAAVVISIATSIGVSLLLSPAFPVSRSLLSLTLALLIVSVRQASFLEWSLSSLACLLTHRVSPVFAKTSRENHSIAWILLHALLLLSRQCWDARSGVNSTSRIDRRRPFFHC